MVVSINGFGPNVVAGSLAENAPGNAATQRREERGQTVENREERLDKVEISQKALDQAQAEALARDVARELADKEDQSLGLNPDFDEAG